MKKKILNTNPPYFAELILKFFFPDGGKFTTIGDMFESYKYIFETEGKWKANFWYNTQVLKSVIPVFLNLILWGTDMLKNYILLAWRNFKKHKMHSSINLIGLTFGIAASIIILLFTIDELNFDKFNTKYDRIARIINEEFVENAESRRYPFTSGIVGKTLEQDYPEVENYVNIIDRQVFGRFATEYGDFKHYESEYLITQPSFLKIFDYEIIKGNPDKLLNEPNEIVLTESAANMFFGTDDPIGKVLKTDGAWGDLKVAGLMKDPPKNSHLQFTMLISFKSLNAFGPRFEQAINNWNASTVKTYMLFNSESSMNNFPSKLSGFVEKNKTDVFGTKEKLFLQPLKDVHFYSTNFELDSNYSARSITTIYILGIIGFFIILSACINYSNLSIARYFNRAKEMGMRKVVGATKAQLYSQILSEAVFMTLLSVAAAIVIIQVLLPALNVYFEKDLSLTSVNVLLFVTMLVSLSLVVGILSGSLPAFFLTKVKTVSLMKMRLNPGSSISIIKKSLVVLQFVISIVMVFATITVYNQLNFIKSKELGFNKEAMVIVDINSGDARKSFEAIKSEFSKSNNVTGVSVVSRVPGDWKGLTELDVNNTGANENEKQKMFYVCADEDFLNTFDIKLKEGNNFTGNPLVDSAGVIINNSAVQALNISNPIGKLIEIRDNQDSGSYKIIGVVNDYNFQSLHQKVSPLIIGHRKTPFDNIDYFAAKINTANISQTINHLKSVHEKFDKVTPFEYNFLDEKIAEFYEQDQKEGTIINAASFISILIACLGLFGLASYTAQQKIKEIGIRKVLGASIPEIVIIFSKEFVKLVLFAAAIALPLAFYFMNGWLESFAYKINIGAAEILAAGLSAFIIALLTISYQAIKSANTNPVETIRNE
ncbi:MAG: hypothetical protein A2068_04370 [Ignavibacteria bacterium GWB2_35_6b]|nr:MAG: hypothetical protein A2068_04370 [Ignavibacteria bacterium GWB2_35_6b]